MTDNDLRALGDACWERFDFGRDWNRHLHGSQLIPIDNGLAYIASRGVVGNVTVVDTDDGLIVIDCGSRHTAGNIHKAIRDWSQKPIRTVIYTHGHLDHALGTPLFDAEAEQAGLIDEQERRSVVDFADHADIAIQVDDFPQDFGLAEGLERYQQQQERAETIEQAAAE